MRNPKSVQEYETSKIHRDFEIQTDHLISARQPGLVTIDKKKKRNSRIIDFAVPAEHKIKIKESEKRDKY